MNPLSSIMKQILGVIFELTGDYGVAIVGITLLIRCCMLPLNYKQRKSMKRQQQFGKQMEEIKAKYKGDKKRSEEELQKLISKEGTGGMGCLLMFLQLPVLYSLYQVVQGGISKEFSTRLLPWVSSLVVKDPYYIVPLLAVLIQIFPHLFPYVTFFRNLDLSKQNIGMVAMMAILSGWIFFFLPSGVGLYYLVSGAFTLVEQTIVNLFELRRSKAVLE